MVSRFNLPKLADNVYYSYIESHLKPPLRSPSASGIPQDKPFFINPKRSILGLEFVLINDSTNAWVNFVLVIRWQHLLARCLERIAYLDSSSTTLDAITCPWHEWGPINSRLFPLPDELSFATTTTGSRWVNLGEKADHPGTVPAPHPPRTLEVYDFDQTRIRIAAQRAVTVKHKGHSIRVLQIQAMDINSDERRDDINFKMDPHFHIQLVDATTRSLYPTSSGLFAEDICTYLPYLRTTHIKPGGHRHRFKEKREELTQWLKRRFRKGGGRDSCVRSGGDDPITLPPPRHGVLCQWDGILVEDERIIGITFNSTNGEILYDELDTIYLG